jgi:ribonuclease HI
MIKKLVINTDGGARGNPGPAGIGMVFFDDKNRVIAKFKKFIGEATNNSAEYQALIMALEKAKDFEYDQVEYRLDSELVIKQLKGEYRVKDKNLKELFAKVQELSFFKPVSFKHIRREQNKIADKLVNEAIDEAGF